MGTVPLERADEAQAHRLRKFKVRLRLAARVRGYASMNALASASGVMLPTISRYMAGDRLPSMPILMKLADALDVTTDWLAGYAPAETIRRGREGARIQLEAGRMHEDADDVGHAVG